MKTRRDREHAGARRHLEQGRAAATAAVLAVLLILGLGLFVYWRQGRLERDAARRAEDAAAAAIRGAGELEAARSKAASPPRAAEKPTAAREESPQPVQPALEPAPEEEGGGIEGKVRVAGAELPAPGVVVVARLAGEQEEGLPAVARRFDFKARKDDRTAEAGADGAYRIGGLEEGEYRVFVDSGKTDFIPIPPSRGVKVAVKRTDGPAALDLEVEPGGAVHGTVTDAEENPLEGVEVAGMAKDFLESLLDPDPRSPGIRETRTTAGGTYRLGGLPFGKALVVRTQARDRANAGSDELMPTEEEPVIRRDFILFPGSRIGGKVADARGGPVAGAAILVLGQEPSSLFGPEFNRSETSGAGGEFLTAPLAAGRYTLKASGPRGEEASREVECDGKTGVSGVVLVFEAMEPAAEESSLAGRVVDDQGAPLPGIALTLTGFSAEKGALNRSTTSAPDGSFRFEGLAPGTFNLNSGDAGHAPCLRTGLVPGIEPVEVVLPRLARVRGQVVGRPRGEPVAGASVKLSAASEGPHDDIYQRVMRQMLKPSPVARTAGDGSYLIENVSPGRLRVRAEAPAFGPGYTAEFDVLPGRETAAPRLALGAGASVAGRVVGPDGKPAPGARVRAQEIAGDKMDALLKRMMPGMLGGAEGPGATAGEDGAFLIEHLPAGSLVLSAADGEFAPGEEEVTLGADDARTGVRLRLRHPAAVRVVVQEREKPLPGYMVQLIGSGPMKMGNTGPEGSCRFQGVGPGRYMVHVMNLAAAAKGGTEVLGSMKQRPVRVEEGQEVELKVVFGVGAKVQGKVRGVPPGLPVMISLRRPGGPSPFEIDSFDMEAGLAAAEFNAGVGIVQKDGTFAIGDVPDGEYILEVSSLSAALMGGIPAEPEDRKPLHRQTIKIEGGKDLECNLDLKM